MSYKFNIDEFPYFCGIFPIPKGTILYCNIDTPTKYYFVKTSNTTKIFKTTKEIYLYDFRHVKKILLDLLTYCKKDTVRTINACKVLALSYGICSLERQLELVKEFYPNDTNLYKSLIEYSNSSCLVEPQGIRIIEQQNDILTSHLLKYLLRYTAEGIVTNKLYPLTDTKQANSVELILFYVDKNNLLEEIREGDIQITKILDWKYWLDRFSEVHYRPGNINPEFYIKTQHNDVLFSVEKTKKLAKNVISELVDHTSLVPFTPKFTAIDISPWTKITYK
jgi:hypothetical protein